MPNTRRFLTRVSNRGGGGTNAGGIGIHAQQACALAFVPGAAGVVGQSEPGAVSVGSEEWSEARGTTRRCEDWPLN
jgi:hypothetical protein